MIKYNPMENKIEGYMGEKELVEIYYMVKKSFPYTNTPMNVLEVGSWQGRSAHAICSAVIEQTGNKVGDSKAVFVDNWLKEQELGVVNGTALRAFRANILNNSEFRHLKKELHEGTSLSYKATCINTQFDFIFIDASHDYRSVKADIINCWPLLKERGYMMGHDFRPQLKNRVADAVIELFGVGYFERMAGSLWGVRKTHSVIGGDANVFHKGKIQTIIKPKGC